MLQRRTELARTGFKPRDKPLAGGGPIARKTAMPRAKKPLAQQSAKMKIRQAAKNAAYGHVREAEWCPACGRPVECTPSHVLTTGLYKQHEADPANIIPLCWTCHCIWQDHKPRFKELYPAIWAQKMKALRDLAPDYFRKKQALDPTLYSD